MESTTKAHLTDRTIWVRLLYMLILAIAYSLAETILIFVAIFQVVAVLLTGSVNAAVLRFGNNLSSYIYEILQFATFNDERLPFPFSDWPDDVPGRSPWLDEPQDEADMPRDAADPADDADRMDDDRSPDDADDLGPQGKDPDR